MGNRRNRKKRDTRLYLHKSYDFIIRTRLDCLVCTRYCLPIRTMALTRFTRIGTRSLRQRKRTCFCLLQNSSKERTCHHREKTLFQSSARKSHSAKNRTLQRFEYCKQSYYGQKSDKRKNTQSQSTVQSHKTYIEELICCLPSPL